MRAAVNFINSKRANFSHERRFSSYVLALSKKLYEKFIRKTLMKLTPGIVHLFLWMLQLEIGFDNTSKANPSPLFSFECIFLLQAFD